jgi:amidohydrolase
MLLGAARLLNERRDSFAGNVKLMFQPAEEHGTVGGAKPMIDAGLLESPQVDAAFGLHIGALNYVGEIAISPGPRSAAADKFTITVKGRGGHAARPNMTVDPIVIAAQIVTALQTLVSREIDTKERIVITVANIEAGTTFNVIPSTAVMRGTVRTYAAEVRDLVEQRMKELVTGIAAAMRAEADVLYERGYPALINHATGVEIVRAAVAETMGPAILRDAEPVMGAEDFAYLLERVPGAFLTLGVRNKTWLAPKPNHEASFDLDEDALPIGAAALAATAVRFLNEA